MRTALNNRGFTILEAIASVAIITLVFTTALMMIITMRNQTIATENKRVALDIASSIREDLIQTLTYQSVSTWLGDNEKTIDSTTCLQFDSPISCQVFLDNETHVIKKENISITFYRPTLEETTFRITRFQIHIAYHKTRVISIEGVIYA